VNISRVSSRASALRPLRRKWPGRKPIHLAGSAMPGREGTYRPIETNDRWLRFGISRREPLGSPRSCQGNAPTECRQRPSRLRGREVGTAAKEQISNKDTRPWSKRFRAQRGRALPVGPGLNQAPRRALPPPARRHARDVPRAAHGCARAQQHWALQMLAWSQSWVRHAACWVRHIGPLRSARSPPPGPYGRAGGPRHRGCLRRATPEPR
jgi:hypothetical protein